MHLLKNYRKKPLALTIAVLSSLGMPAMSATIVDLDSVVGDGFIFVDPDEGVVAPGAKAVTTAANNDDFVSANGFSPNGVANCIMANNAFTCGSPPGSGKRVKNNLTGFGSFDAVYNATSSGGTTEYFNYGKVTNQTPARMTGLKIVVGTGTGADFVPSSVSGEAVTMDQVVALAGQAAAWPGNGGVDGQNPLQRLFFPDGLFGDGGHEALIGYFDPDSSGFIFVPEGTDTLSADGIFGAYSALFGNGILSRSQVPEALFHDADNDPATEASLLYWKAGDLWLDGAGVVQDAAAIEALLADDAYSVGIIEDLSNTNINYSIDVGDMTVDQFTVRITPIFSPIVAAAQSDYQLAVATSLDQTSIPYLFLDQTTAVGDAAATTADYNEFQEVIGALEGLPSAQARAQALEGLGTSYLRNFGLQANLLGRDHLEHVKGRLGDQRNGQAAKFEQANGGYTTPYQDDFQLVAAGDSGADAAQALAQANTNQSTAVSEKVTAFLIGSASTGEFDQTLNGSGSDFSSYSISAGADYRFSDDVLAGLALSYGQSNGDIDDGRGELELDGTSLMAYGSFGASTGVYFDAVAGYSWLEYDNQRDITIGADFYRKAKSDTEGEQLNVALELGYNFMVGDFLIGPSVQYQYFDLEVDGYSESGAGVLNMTVDDLDFESESVWVGAEGSMIVETEKGFIEPRMSLYWITELEDEALLADTRFSSGVLDFSTPIDARDDGYLRASIGLASHFTTDSGRPVVVQLDYQGTYSNDDYTEHRASFGVELMF